MNKLPTSITETQSLLTQKKTTVSQLVESCLQNVNKNKDLNAFITISEDRAFKQAADSDETLNNLGPKAFDQKPLLGVTISYKDLFLTKDIRTTAGSNVLKEYIPQYSSTVVKRLEKAGAICIGKTNCDAWGHGSSGENSDFGPTKNPWNTNYVPGGSSSGSAVAVAAQMSLVTTGTDTGGSIRMPASFTGVYGLKPTYGSVSRYGVIALASSLDSIGHFASNAEDIQKVFTVTKGEDQQDANVKNESKYKDSKDYTIGIPKQYFEKGLDNQVEKKVMEAAKTLEKSGIKLKEVNLPHTKYAVAAYYIIMPAEVSSNLARYDGIRYGNDRGAFGDEAKRRIMLGSYVLSSGYYDAYYLKAMKVRSLIKSDFDKAFHDVDALLTPVSPTSAFKIGEKSSDPLQMYLSDILTVAPSLTGIPALAVPCGFDLSNLPIGFQLLAPHFSEKTLFDIAKQYEQLTNWKFKPPQL